MALRSSEDDMLYANLEDLLELANKVCGNNNNFNFIQTPVNYSMMDILLDFQTFKG